jgi:hypothetical protein
LSASPIQTQTQLPTTCSGKRRTQALCGISFWPGISRHLPSGANFQPVIHAAQRVALEAAERQRREAVRAAVLQRDDAPSPVR